MEKKTNDLWQGGPWEQSSPPALKQPVLPQPTRPVLRVRKRRRRPWIMPLLACVLAVGVGIAGGAWWVQLRERMAQPPAGYTGVVPFPYEEYEYWYENWEASNQNKPPKLETAPPDPQFTLDFQAAGEELDYVQIYDTCTPSILSVTAYREMGQGRATGVVLNEQGYFLTNAHVITGAYRVQVVTHDNRVGDVQVVGYSFDEDLAVLKVDLPDLVPARFGSSEELRIGEAVAAIGSPMGYQNTITDGIISALDREVPVDGVTMTMLQTSAALNSGSSGGVLVDRFGRVVGITTLKLVAGDGSSEAMGFAIPSLRVKYVVERIMAGEDVVAGALGVTVNTRPVEGGGLEVLSVEENSDAAAQGIRVGDILLRANGMDLNSTQPLVRLKTSRGAGDTITLTVQRGEKIFDVDVALIPARSQEDTP